MFNGGTQTIVVNPTNPDHEPKARITTSEGSVLTELPSTVTSRPSTFKDVEVVIEDECFEPITVNVSKTATAAYWANIFNIMVFSLILLQNICGNSTAKLRFRPRKRKNVKLQKRRNNLSYYFLY